MYLVDVTFAPLGSFQKMKRSAFCVLEGGLNDTVVV